MKISLNAIKEIYKQAGVDTGFLPDNIKELVEKIGVQLGEVEEVIDLGKKYEDVVIAKVVSCELHPNADKLKICKIDAGKSDLVQVVCGAPNVTANMFVVWIPPGATVPATFDKDPFVLEAREIRGELSNGMLASPSELGISDDHDGILEVDKQSKPGDSFAALYKLDDHIIDIENKMFTHRPDCFGLLGAAREIAGIYGVKFNGPQWFVAVPELPKIQTKELKLEIVNAIPKLVPRFCAVAIADVKVDTSPVWLQVALSKFGVKSINNIVDLTNFYMILIGQPLHAYDYDKVAELSGKDGAVINIHLPKKAEKIKLLNGKEVESGPHDIAISTDRVLIGLGGVIGGSDTEVDGSTKNIILECANFNPYSIRRTSMNHGIFTDAVTRFSKNQSPFQNPAVIIQSAESIVKLSGGKLASEIIDIQGELSPSKPVKITDEFINSRLGLELSEKDISLLLANVEFTVEKDAGGLSVIAPFWRTDIEIAEDIVEEVGRLYGYDNLPLVLPKKTISPATIEPELTIKQTIRNGLSALGANEVLTYSFVHGDLLDKVGQDKTESFKIKNALSPELQYYRQSLTPSLLEKVHPNIKAGFNNFALFETGKVHLKSKEAAGMPKEFSRVAMVVADKNSKSAAYYSARNYLIELIKKLGISENDIIFEPIKEADKDSAVTYYLKERAASIKVSGQLIGRLGEYNSSVSSSLKLPEFCAGFELSLTSLLQLKPSTYYRPLSKYPAIEQDVSLNTGYNLPYEKISAALKESLAKNLPEDVDIEIKCLDIFAKNDKTKHTTFRLTATSYERTLTGQIINTLLEKSEPDLKKTINAERI